MNRKVTIVLGALVIAAGVGIKKYMSAQAEPPKRNPSGGVPSVWVRKVSNGFVSNSIAITGKLVANNRIELFAEVQGTVLSSNTTFKEGMSFLKGQRLLRIDSTEFHLNLLSAKSNFVNSLIQLSSDIKFDFPKEYGIWMAYTEGIDIKKPLPELPTSDDKKFTNFLIARNVNNQFYSIKSQEEKLTKFNLKAPFSGVLVEGNLQPGSMVRAGQKLGIFIEPGSYELEASVNMNDGAQIKVGDSVRLVSEDIPGKWFGKVARISEHIDQSTQTLKVYIAIQSKRLKEGMYLNGNIYAGGFENAIRIPRNLLIGTNELYTVSDSTLALQEVNVLSIGENEVVVSGIDSNTTILGQVFSTAYNGMVINPQFKK